MVTDSEIRHLPVAEKLFLYADSYLHGATALCERLTEDQVSCTWADGAVVLMLSAHATEVFLKGALLKRAPEPGVWARGHDIEGLTLDYHAYFPEPEYAWEVPFRAEYPEGMSDADIAELKALRDGPPSILYRYPVQKFGEEWNGLYAFEPNSFLPVLQQLRDDFKRIRAHFA